MKIIFEKNNLTYEETLNYFNKYTTGYLLCDEKEYDENYSVALYVSKVAIKVEVEYCKDTDTNNLRIIEYPLNLNTVDCYVDIETINMKQQDKTKAKLSFNQILYAIEGLVAYKHLLSERDYSENKYLYYRREHQYTQIDTLFQYLQDVIGYSYDGKCEECSTRKLKKSNNLGLGQDGLTQLIAKK